MAKPAKNKKRPKQAPRMGKERKHALILIGDVHAGGGTGPHPRGGPRQRWLAERFEEAWSGALRKYKDHHITLGLGGEMVDLPGYGGRQVALEILSPLVDKVRALKGQMYGLLGTAYHVGPEGDDDRQVYDQLGITDISDGRQFELGGKIVWHAHHGLKIGANWYTETDSLYRAVKNLVMRARYYRQDAPSAIIAHHYHRSPPDGVYDGALAHIVPAWKLPDRYAAQKVTWSRPDVGLSVYIPEDGRIDRAFHVEIPNEFLWQ